VHELRLCNLEEAMSCIFSSSWPNSRHALYQN